MSTGVHFEHRQETVRVSSHTARDKLFQEWTITTVFFQAIVAALDFVYSKYLLLDLSGSSIYTKFTTQSSCYETRSQQYLAKYLFVLSVVLYCLLGNT
jgi:hypothetical protein